MALLDAVSARLGRPVPPPRLRIVQPDEQAPASNADQRTARPESFADFIGQGSVTYNLEVECIAARDDGKLPDHILLEGPAGLGKTSLARCVAEHLGVRFVEIPATTLDKVDSAAKELAKIGMRGESTCVVFVDEIHGACKKAQLYLLSALEDGWFQPSGAARFELADFCLIGATTNPGKLEKPLRDRFSIRESLDYYPVDEIQQIIRRYSDRQGYVLDDKAVELIAAVGRGTPRVATGITRRVATFARVAKLDSITGEAAEQALGRLGIDEWGLEPQDRAILKALCQQERPVGLEALAAMLGIEEDAVEQREPYLLRRGLLQRPKGGRTATRLAYIALRMPPSVMAPA